MFWKLVTCVLVFIAAAIGFGLLGGLLVLFRTESTELIGTFLKNNSLVLGLVTAVCYFIWGKRFLPLNN